MGKMSSCVSSMGYWPWRSVISSRLNFSISDKQMLITTLGAISGINQVCHGSEAMCPQLCHSLFPHYVTGDLSSVNEKLGERYLSISLSLPQTSCQQQPLSSMSPW